MTLYALILVVGVAIAGILNVAVLPDAERSIAASRHVTASEAEAAAEQRPVPAAARPRTEPGQARPGCLSAERMLTVLALDAEQVGGDILVLSGGIEQELADQWRRELGLAPVDVSQVLAHIVPGADGEAVVDVVEIDANGCALSRTLMTQTGWSNLVTSAWGVEV